MNIQTFINAFNGGARPNRFLVEVESGSVVGPASFIPASGGNDGTSVLSGGDGSLDPARTPGVVGSAISFPIHIRATRTPEYQMGVINVNYRGKSVPYPGDRGKLPDWEIVVLDDVSNMNSTNKYNHLHRFFMDWSRSICPTDARLGVVDWDSAVGWNNGINGNIWRVTALEHSELTSSNTQVTQWNRSFRLFNCWPKEVGPIQLDMSKDNTLNYFRVVLCYSHTAPFDSTTGTVAW